MFPLLGKTGFTNKIMCFFSGDHIFTTQWRNWVNTWAGAFSGFLGTCICVNWARSAHTPCLTRRSDRFGLFLLVSQPGYIISLFSTNFPLTKLPLQNFSLEIFCNTPYYSVLQLLFREIPVERCLFTWHVTQ